MTLTSLNNALSTPQGLNLFVNQPKTKIQLSQNATSGNQDPAVQIYDLVAKNGITSLFTHPSDNQPMQTGLGKFVEQTYHFFKNIGHYFHKPEHKIPEEICEIKGTEPLEWHHFTDVTPFGKPHNYNSIVYDINRTVDWTITTLKHNHRFSDSDVDSLLCECIPEAMQFIQSNIQSTLKNWQWYSWTNDPIYGYGYELNNTLTSNGTALSTNHTITYTMNVLFAPNETLDVKNFLGMNLGQVYQYLMNDVHWINWDKNFAKENGDPQYFNLQQILFFCIDRSFERVNKEDKNIRIYKFVLSGGIFLGVVASVIYRKRNNDNKVLRQKKITKPELALKEHKFTKLTQEEQKTLSTSLDYFQKTHLNKEKEFPEQISIVIM